MAEELCWQPSENGARCTLPKGHTGDHVACSVTKTNIVAAWRGDNEDD